MFSYSAVLSSLRWMFTLVMLMSLPLTLVLWFPISKPRQASAQSASLQSDQYTHLKVQSKEIQGKEIQGKEMAVSGINAAVAGGGGWLGSCGLCDKRV